MILSQKQLRLIQDVAAVSRDFFGHVFFQQFWDEYSDQIGQGHTGMTAFVADLGVVFHQQFEHDNHGIWLTSVQDFVLQFFIEANGAALEDVKDIKFLLEVARKTVASREDTRRGRAITIRGFKKAPAKFHAGPNWGQEGGYVKSINRDHHRR